MTMVHHTPDPEARARWRLRRAQLEAESGRQSTKGRRRQSFLVPLEPLMAATFKLTGLFRRGLSNALDITLTRLDMEFDTLPAAFDGLVILHLSDLHLGLTQGLESRVAALIRESAPDLVVLTGDYQYRGGPDGAEIGRMLAPILAAARPRHGAIAILGNHDGHRMVEVLEGLGVHVLVNEHCILTQAGQNLTVTGVDDVHKFHTPDADSAIRRPAEGFRLALVHTPELAGTAAAAGFDLYLCGHTHGGQICLPGGRAVFTLVDAHPELSSGRWRLGAMRGYTSRGVGVGFPPLRFNCPGEAVLLTMRRASPKHLGSPDQSGNTAAHDLS